MGFKDFMYTEKGKITGSVLAAVLLTTAVMVPVSIFTDRAVRGEDVTTNNIQAWGYDDNVTSTGLRQDNWMGIDPSTMTDASGKTITSMEATLLNNSDYNGVTKDEDLLMGVKNSDGIGYLSNSHVQNFSGLKALNISEDNGATWIEPGDADYIAAPLNMVMKVPQGVSEKIKDAIKPGATALSISDLDGLSNSVVVNGDKVETASDSYDYGTWLQSKDLAKDFALSVVAFNWIAQAQPAFDQINTEYASINDAAFADAKAFQDWARGVFGGANYAEWGIFASDAADADWAFTNEQILIDGTGTDENAVNLGFAAFNEQYPGHTISQKLNNGGSYRAWETAPEYPVGVVENIDEYDGTQNGSTGAFIGTQSRGMEVAPNMKDPAKVTGGEISYWGYDETAYGNNDTLGNVNTKDMENIIYDFEAFEGNAELPLATTIAGDQVVFFTSDDTTFVHNGETYTPTGITQAGAKFAYQLGATWDQLLTFNLISAELV